VAGGAGSTAAENNNKKRKLKKIKKSLYILRGFDSAQPKQTMTTATANAIGNPDLQWAVTSITTTTNNNDNNRNPPENPFKIMRRIETIPAAIPFHPAFVGRKQPIPNFYYPDQLRMLPVTAKMTPALRHFVAANPDHMVFFLHSSGILVNYPFFQTGDVLTLDWRSARMMCNVPTNDTPVEHAHVADIRYTEMMAQLRTPLDFVKFCAVFTNRPASVPLVIAVKMPAVGCGALERRIRNLARLFVLFSNPYGLHFFPGMMTATAVVDEQ
jgi:hypothetical protein